jgi:hypothetical protein
MYIAFTYPFSYEDCNSYFDSVQQAIETKHQDSIYFHRELLTYSLEGRNVELMTLSGHNDKREDLEEDIPHLFPEYDQGDAVLRKRFKMTRPHKFNKKCIFLSARVHPGEV